MEKNEIKKALYRQKPMASLMFIRGGKACYSTWLENTERERILFEVPVSDMGDADFFPSMDAKLLIRWIVETQEQSH